MVNKIGTFIVFILILILRVKVDHDSFREMEKDGWL